MSFLGQDHSLGGQERGATSEAGEEGGCAANLGPLGIKWG